MTCANLILCVLLVLLPFWDVVCGARMLGELPPCKDVPGGVRNWDCYDPPSTPLPPCDFNHQNPGIDCSLDSQNPPPRKVEATATDTTAAVASSNNGLRSVPSAGGAHHVQGMLPPCKDVPGGVRNWDCYDPPSTPLPPCDFNHQNPGIDCSLDSQNPPPRKPGRL